MTYIFKTSNGERGIAIKDKDNTWTCKINGHLVLWLSGGTVYEMQRAIREDFPNATFQRYNRLQAQAVLAYHEKLLKR